MSDINWFKHKALLAIPGILIFGFLVFKGYIFDRDIDSLIDRAQVGANQEHMLSYMQELRENMAKYGMITGHTKVIFQNPRNDMALHYQAVKDIIARLESIEDLPRNETAYQVALDDIRGVIRELPNPAMGWLWVKYSWWILSIYGGYSVWISTIYIRK